MKIAFLLSLVLTLFTMNTHAQTHSQLAEIWDKEHVSNKFPSNVRHKDVQKYIDGLKKHGVKVEEVGRSY